MSCFMYVGSLGAKPGICAYRFDEEKGTAERVQSAFTKTEVGHAMPDEERGLVYFTDQVSANPAFPFGGGGEVLAMKADEVSGELSLLDKSLSYGVHPTYTAFDREKKYMIVPHFTPGESVATLVERDEKGGFAVKPVLSDANTVLFEMNPDGSFGRVSDVYTHPAEPELSVNPHLHSVNLSPLWDVFAVCDMGTDKVYMFSLRDGRLLPSGNTPLQLPRGCGPRYSAFHPTKPVVFINCERKPLVKSFRYDENGNLTELCSVSALPEGMEEDRHFNPTDISLSADGKFLYAAVRGADIISVFETDADTGALKMVQSYKLQGEGPRGCNLTPDGRFLAVANKLSGTVEILRVDGEGRLSPNCIVEDMRPGVVVFLKR